MDQSNIINLGLLGVTAIGIAITAWQALDARRARDDARAARDEAQESEAAARRASVDAAAAATRSAEALEQRNEIERAKLPKDPWSLEKVGKSKYELRNITENVMHVVSVDELGDGNDITLFDDDLQDVGPGESIFFDYSKTLESPASTTLHVSWGDPMTGDRSFWRRTLS